jgi:hypothetical protein
MKILKFLVNVISFCLILYCVTATFMLTDIGCEDFNKCISRSFYFQMEWFLYLLTISTISNILIERKIKKENITQKILKVVFLQTATFIVVFALNSYILYKSVC